MAALIRDAPIGQIIRLVTRNKVLRYPEEEPDFVCPGSYRKESEANTLVDGGIPDAEIKQDSAEDESIKQEDFTDMARQETMTRPHLARTRTAGSHTGSNRQASYMSDASRQLSNPNKPSRPTNLSAQQTAERQMNPDPSTLEKAESRPIVPQRTADGIILVDWYATDDPENPQNWSVAKKGFVVLIICLYTFSVYIGSAIYTPAIPGVMEQFGVSLQVAELGLSMYVLAYGISPMIWSPLSEVPIVGRNGPYLATFTIFVILLIPTSVVQNFAGLIVLRFLQGFFGAPALATGGASMQDLFTFINLPYLLSLWVGFATLGPALGPTIGGYSLMSENWHWFSWEMLWLAGPVLILMLLALPETSGPNLLLRRAKRLRKLTGNMSLKSQSEIDQENLRARDVATEALLRPIQITLLDPAVLFTNLYTMLVYGIYYSFFEAFPLVYPGLYGFNAGEAGLAFLPIVVATVIAVIAYWCFWGFVVVPAMKRGDPSTPENILIPACAMSFLLPIGLFLFGWTANVHVHWIASMFGILIYSAAVFIIIQCLFLYLPITYPQYAASLFATNDLFRSVFATGAIHFAGPLYRNLGIGPGISLLAGLTVGCIGGIFLLFFFGANLRARSKYAVKSEQ